MKSIAYAVLAIILATGILEAEAAKKKFCRGDDGIKYKPNQGYKEGCTEFTCVKKGKKLKMTSKPIPNCRDTPQPPLTTPPSLPAPEDNVNVTALQMNVDSLNATVETLQATVQALLSVVTKQGTCMSDFMSSDCPATTPGKISLVDRISSNTDGIDVNKADVSSNRDGIVSNTATYTSIQAATTNIETCLADVNSVKCPFSKDGKTSVSDAIIKNKEDVEFYHTGISTITTTGITASTTTTSTGVYFIGGGTAYSRYIQLYIPTLENLKCSITPPSLNRDWESHTSFYHSNTIYLCGGYENDKEENSTASICISYNNKMNGWTTHTMSIYRYYGHTSVVLKNTLYLIGGVDTNRDNQYSVFTPLPLTNQPVFTPIPNLDYKGYYQCTAKIDEDTFIITGGSEGGTYLDTITQYSTKTGTTTSLPSLATGRYHHGCVLAEINKKKWLIISGGVNYRLAEGKRYLQSTEMLELGGGSWTSLGDLNVPRVGFSMIAAERGVMAIAGYDFVYGGNYLKSVELLDWTSKKWKVVEPSTHKVNYNFGGAVEIPASLFDCAEPTLTTTTQAITTNPPEVTTTSSTITVYFIAGGVSWSQHIELYRPSIDNLKCSITPPPLNRDWKEHTSFYHSNTIYLCGGYVPAPEDSTASLCISYNNKLSEWKTHTLSISIYYGHTSVVLKNTLYLIGGVDTNRAVVGSVSTPLPLTNKPVFTAIPNLDFKGTYPCTAKIDEDTFVITGGYDRSTYFDTVTQYSTKTGTTTSLPSLATGRYKHGCVLAEINNKKWLIVSGGVNYRLAEGKQYLQSTEMLELGGKSWTSLGDINVPRVGFSMIATERGVMAIAGYDFVYGGYYLNSVELLDWSSKTWKVVEPSIQKNTYMFGGAVPIPASMFDCSEKLWRDDGRCGASYPLPSGQPGQCDPTADANEKGPCCSPGGYCGNSDQHCKCSSCVNYAVLGLMLNPVVLLTGGHGPNNSVQVFGIGKNKHCNKNLEDLPDTRWDHTIHFFNGKIILCGSQQNGNTCLFLNENQIFVHHSQLKDYRSHHVGAVVNNKILISGGSGNPLQMQFWDGLQWEYSENFSELSEFETRSCMAAISEDTILMAGGASERGSKLTNKMLKYKDGKWERMEDYPGVGRRGHGCAFIQTPEGDAFLIAGGWYLDTSILYNIEKRTWEEVGKMANGRLGGKILNVGGRIIMVGGSYGPVEVEEYDVYTKTWSTIPEKLKEIRGQFDAVVVPGALVGC